jgi:hypothetical protein
MAIALATFLYFALGGVWFTVFQKAWLAGVGRTMQDLLATGISPAISYSIAIVTTLILAIFLSWLIQATGPQTLARGITIAVLAWFGVVFPTWGAEYAFELRSLQAFAINTGYSLTGMIIMGAVLGAWKKKA